MQFTLEEIELAMRLRHLGLPWEPKAGHFVYDMTSFCKQRSPFQEQVYFILNYNYFMKTVGGVERFQQIFVWLPTWHDCREILNQLDVSDGGIATHIRKRRGIESGTERL